MTISLVQSLYDDTIDLTVNINGSGIYPVLLSKEESNSLAISQRLKSPLELAGVPLEEACDTLKRFNIFYNKSVLKYRKLAQLAIDNDEKVILRLNSESRCTKWKYMLYGLPLFLIGGYFGYRKGVKKDRYYVERSGSSYRRGFLQGMHVLEQDRIESMCDEIFKRCETLVKETIELVKANQFDTNIIKEMKQLYKLFTVLRPDTEFYVNEQGKLKLIAAEGHQKLEAFLLTFTPHGENRPLA